MKHKNLIILAILFIISTAYVILKFDKDYLNPLNTRFELKYPFFATKDKNGLFYVIDKSKTRIVVFNSEGIVQKILEGGEKSENNFFYASELFVDENGYIYVISITNSMTRYAVDKEEILRFKPDGGFDKLVFQKKYSENDSPVRWGRLSELSLINGKLFLFYIYPNGVDELTIDPESGVAEKRNIISGENSGMIIKFISPLPGNGYAYLTKKGEIYKTDYLNNNKLLYDGDFKTDGKKTIPWHLSTLKNGTIYFSDLEKRTIFRIDASDQVSETITSNDFDKLSGRPFENRFKNMRAFDDGTLFAILGDIVYYYNKYELKTYAKNLKLKNIEIINRSAYLAVFLLSILTLFAFAWFFYKQVLNYRIPLIIKQIIIYIPLIIAVLIFTSWYIQKDYSTRLKKEMVNKLNILLSLAPKEINGDLVNTIQNPHDYMNENYKALRNSLHEVLNYNKDEWNAPFYVLLHRNIGNWQYLMMDYDDSTCIYWPYEYNQKDSYVYKVLDGKIITDFSEDQEGMWLYGDAPLYDSSGKIVALVEIGADLYNYIYYEKTLFYRISKMMGISILFIATTIIFVSLFMISAIRRLRNGVQRISSGELDTSVKIRTRDEVQDLGDGFNKMAEYIKNYVKEISDINDVYFKFMPYQFMEYLGLSSITNIKLGDNVQNYMSVMFTDIRSFTTHSESKTPKENFEFVNQFLSKAGPEIRLHNGFIDKYIGDAIMALFPKADDALDAAISMYRKICVDPKSRIKIGKENIAIGIGIYTGPVMLGIVGESERMSSTVISDSVNIASRIESLTKMYRANIMISKSTLNLLANPEKYNYRFLGNVQVKGKSEAIGLFEILDCYESEKLSKRLFTKESFESAVKSYHKGLFTQAETWFKEVLGFDPEDYAAKLYLNMCRNAIKERAKSGRMFTFDSKE